MLTSDNHEETTFSFSARAPEPPERRTATRHMTILRVGALIAGGNRELCLIRNISAGGLMAHVYCRHLEGEEVAVELRTEEPIAGRVVWSRESNVGIQFDEPIDVEEILASQAAQANGWRPRLPRVEVDRLATVRMGARVVGVNTCDISQGGVKIESDVPLPPGAEVVVALERFRPVPGIIRWSTGGHCGISFNQVIPFGELMAWLRPERAGAA
jgi:hypothetical protein